MHPCVDALPTSFGGRVTEDDKRFHLSYGATH